MADDDGVALELGREAADFLDRLSRCRKRTTIYRLTEARCKLDAENSRHTISKAISLKLIAPN